MIVRKCGSGEGGRQQHHRWFVHPATNQGGIREDEGGKRMFRGAEWVRGIKGD